MVLKASPVIRDLVAGSLVLEARRLDSSSGFASTWLCSLSLSQETERKKVVGGWEEKYQ